MKAAQEAQRIKKVIFFIIIPLVLVAGGAVKIVKVQQGYEQGIARDVQKIKKFYQDGFSVPSREKIETQNGIVKMAQEKVSSIVSYSCVSPVEIPETVTEKGVYFKERLYLVQKQLLAFAKTNNAVIPETVGFDDRLPTDEEVALMFTRLALVDETVRAMIDSGVKDVSVVKFIEAKRVRDAQEDEMPCVAVSAQVELTCSAAVLKRVLYEIGNLNPFVIIDTIRVTRSKEQLAVQTVLTRLLYKEKA